MRREVFFLWRLAVGIASSQGCDSSIANGDAIATPELPISALPVAGDLSLDCPAIDRDLRATIDELIAAVHQALSESA